MALLKKAMGGGRWKMGSMLMPSSHPTYPIAFLPPIYLHDRDSLHSAMFLNRIPCFCKNHSFSCAFRVLASQLPGVTGLGLQDRCNEMTRTCLYLGNIFDIVSLCAQYTDVVYRRQKKCIVFIIMFLSPKNTEEMIQQQ